MGKNSEYNGENAVDMKDRLKQANKQGQEGVEEKKLLPLPALVPHARARLIECCYLLLVNHPFFSNGRDPAPHRRPMFCCLIQTIRFKEIGSPLGGKFGEGDSKFISWRYYNPAPWVGNTEKYITI